MFPDERGRAIFSKRIIRGKLLDFFAARASCTVARALICISVEKTTQQALCRCVGQRDGATTFPVIPSGEGAAEHVGAVGPFICIGAKGAELYLNHSDDIKRIDWLIQ